ncbi:flagellar hook-associated protein FlgK [Roseovarius ramblicola]|uniref:Flagellar hook-associated protein 1 n=1 Tax=Roseovarius ramblicola TaxID=2022336 RepID=A0ABV5HXM3_9RHOB
MSISAAFNSALSGLTANSRLTEVISGNLANALTPGHAPRTLELEARGTGGGVAVTGVTRHVDPVVLADRRLADSALADAQTRAGFAASLERALGLPGDGGGLADRLAAFEAAVATASSRPEDDARLNAVLREATTFATALNDAAEQIETLRSRADTDIAGAVERLNTSLAQVAEINTRIVSARAAGHETAALEDRRQQAIDGIAELVPVRQLERGRGAVALVSTGGALLLDGRPAQIGFEATPLVAANMTVENGLVSGLEIGGRPAPTGAGGPLAGGRLGALFDNRDGIGPEAQRGLDALARDLAERVESLTPPPSPGLFTDAGARFAPADETGLAGRLAVNPAVDPAQGGTLFRLRTGPDAAAPGPPAVAPYLAAIGNALAARQAPEPGAPQGNLSDHVAQISSRIAQERLAAERAVSFASGQAGELRELELRGGVDSDAELQRLLVVEQAFSANARMIRTLDEMMQTLLRI